MGIFSPKQEAAPPAPVVAAATPVVLPEGLAHAYPAAYNTPRALTASSQRMRLTNRAQAEEVRQRHSMTMAWQEQAWRIIDAIGEVSFAYTLVSAVLSRVRIHAAVLVDPEAPPTEVTDAMCILDNDGTPHGVPGGIDPRIGKEARRIMSDFLQCNVPAMMRTFAWNILAPGECYLAYVGEKWGVFSTSEIRIDAAGQPMWYPSASIANGTPRKLSKATPIGRIWQQHPRYSQDPTSALHAVIEDCEELLLLNRMVRSAARSRLNAGIMFMPDTMSVSADTPGEAENPESEEVDPLEKELLDLATLPIGDESNAATVTPMLVRGPAAEGKEIRHITFSRDGDQFLLERIDKVLHRIVTGVDAPQEKITGAASIKYANARLINEDMYKAHVEPLALMFVDAVTDIYFRPMLRALAKKQGWDPKIVDKLVVWYDPSEITTRPDRGQDANEGYDRMEISGRSWRTAHGFSDTDAPTEEELAKRIAMKAVPPQDTLEALFKSLLPKVLGAARAANGGSDLPDDLSQMLGGNLGSNVDADTSLTPTGDGTGDIAGTPLAHTPKEKRPGATPTPEATPASVG